MNRRYIILFFLFLVLSNSLTAQKTCVGFDTGYGTYAMTDIKHFLENTMNTNVLQPHRVSNFPGYLFFRPYIEIKYPYLNLGIAYTLMSTGARYSIHDYSGEYKFDAQIVGNAAGAFVELPIYSIQRFRFLIAAEAGIISNKLKLDESIKITGIYNQQDDNNLRSINIFVKPYLKVEYELWKSLSANFSLGYHKAIIANKMHLEGDISSVSDIVADWDGYRTSVGISYRFD